MGAAASLPAALADGRSHPETVRGVTMRATNFMAL
jgi:hypothetical protein